MGGTSGGKNLTAVPKSIMYGDLVRTGVVPEKLAG